MTLSPDARQAKLNELYEYGKTKGALTYKDIMDRLMEMDMDPEQLDKVLETLEALGVEVADHRDPVAVKAAGDPGIGDAVFRQHKRLHQSDNSCGCQEKQE